MVPHREKWDAAGIVDKDAVPHSRGSTGSSPWRSPRSTAEPASSDFRYNNVIVEEMCRLDLYAQGLGMTLHNDVCLPYFTEIARTTSRRSGGCPASPPASSITAVAMTEPGMGSDLASMATTRIRDGDEYVLNGSKTFITNGINADLVIVAAKTDPIQRHKGHVADRRGGAGGGVRTWPEPRQGGYARPGHRGAVLQRRAGPGREPARQRRGGLHAAGGEPPPGAPVDRHGRQSPTPGRCSTWTIEYAQERKAFGQPIGTFQNSRFELAEMQTEITIAEAFIDRCVTGLNAGELTTEEASMAKWWCTELQKRVADACVQLHGGYGYMAEYPIARAFTDARVPSIYGGTTEIMKEIIGR